jgi:CheY-like chemotaxis protein
MSDHARLMEFLLVQDDPADELIAREDFATYKVVNSVLAVSDVRSALAYLDGTPPFTQARIPDVVLLDLNLPWPGGSAVLEHLRSGEATAAIPVILLVDSPAAEEIVRSRGLPVQGYARKPVDFACLVSVVRSLPEVGFEVRRS